MKAFEVSQGQICRVVQSLIADELGWRYHRHVEFRPINREDAPIADIIDEDQRFLDDRGLGLSAVEIDVCAKRAAYFFGLDPDEFRRDLSPDLTDWVTAIAIAIRQKLEIFNFVPAGRDTLTGSCAHSAAAIYAEAAAASNLLYGRRRLVSLVKPHSLFGFILSILTPNLQQIPSFDARGLSPPDLTVALSFGDAVVATPSQWRFLLREGVKAPDNAMGVLFGEPFSQSLAVEMRKVGFSAQREVYGSTETGLIGWRDSPNEPFTLFDCLSKNESGLARVLPSGERRAIEPMDVFSWVSPRAFTLDGRRDGAIQVGGINVFPSRVAGIIEAHPLVERCEIGIGEQSTGLTRLIAKIVLKNNSSPTETVARNIDRWCRDELHPFERPRIYSFF